VTSSVVISIACILVWLKFVAGTVPKFPVRLESDIESDIRILSELVEGGKSAIIEEQREKTLEDMMKRGFTNSSEGLPK
jgi:hypothetical protein